MDNELVNMIESNLFAALGDLKDAHRRFAMIEDPLVLNGFRAGLRDLRHELDSAICDLIERESRLSWKP